MIDMISTLLLGVKSLVLELSESLVHPGGGEQLMVVLDRAVFYVLVVDGAVAEEGLDIGRDSVLVMDGLLVLLVDFKKLLGKHSPV